VDYWLTAEQFFSPYSKTVGHDMTWYVHPDMTAAH
jgi:hypothetical protein